MRPTAVDPGQNDESLGGELRVEAGCHLFRNPVDLAVILVEHGNLQRQHRALDVGEAGGREQSRVERAESYLADDVGVVPGNPSGVELEDDLAAGDLLPLLPHLL